MKSSAFAKTMTAAADRRGGMLRPCRLAFIALSVFGLLAFSFNQPSDHIPFSTQPPSSGVFIEDVGSSVLEKGLPPAGNSDDVKNSTLGFERVFVVNLPERHDKLDAFSLASSLTGFSHEVIEGIKGVTVVNKTLPTLDNLPKKERSRNNIVGCWRAHLNFAQKIVRERIQTAIVFEDDSDWDVSFQDQLAEFATGSRYISGTSHTPRSPYGDDWDLLWLGHCSIQQHPADERRFVIENDDSVPPMARRFNVNKVPPLNELGYDNSTRIVFRANDGVCLYSYALSYRGAQKMLQWQNNVKRFEPIDIGLGYQCRDDANFKCIAVFPQLVDSHRSAGRASRDSDISTADATQTRERGYTHNIVRSTRLNLDNLIRGGHSARVENQWGDLPQLTSPRRTMFE